MEKNFLNLNTLLLPVTMHVESKVLSGISLAKFWPIVAKNLFISFDICCLLVIVIVLVIVY